MDGLILVRKPMTWTSHDVVRELRRTLGEKRIGHFGTLDPLASGLLLAAVGKATRLFPYFSVYEKAYEARIRLGIATDTYDAAGTPTSEEKSDLPPAEAVAAALGGFEGEIEQLPPPYSAKKHRGRPLYVYARRNEEVERQSSRVRIHSILLRGYIPPDVEAEVVCSSGTYIRSLAYDLGRALGCGAHLAGLVRTRIGPFRLEDAYDPETIRTLREEGGVSRFLVPMGRLLTDRPALILDDGGIEDVRHGRTVRPASCLAAGFADGKDPSASVVRLLGPDGNLLGLARPAAEANAWAPVVVFL
jgi:tRNA pseudouridine55 synthase